jgi:hypothetical protein
MRRPRKPANPLRHFHSSPEVIRLVVMMYVRFPQDHAHLSHGSICRMERCVRGVRLNPA